MTFSASHADHPTVSKKKMTGTTAEFTARGFDWKKDEMEFVAWKVEDEEIGDINLERQVM